MSKITGEDLDIALKNIYARKKLKGYKYGAGVETVGIQVKLKNYTPKDTRFSGSVKLQYPTRKLVKVCVLGNKKDYDNAKKLGYDALSVEDMSIYKIKNKKLKNKKVKGLAKKYSGFIASSSLISKIPRLLGPGLSKAGKFPVVLESGDTVEEKFQEIANTVKFQFKKEVCIGSAIGHLGLKPDHLRTNIVTCMNFLVSLLKKNWQNVGSITVKSDQGRAQIIYPSGNVELQSEKQLTRRIAFERKVARKKRDEEERKRKKKELEEREIDDEIPEKKVEEKKEEVEVEEKKEEVEKKEEEKA